MFLATELIKRFTISTVLAAADGYCRSSPSPIASGLAFGVLNVAHKVANQVLFNAACKVNEQLKWNNKTMRIIHITTGDVSFLSLLHFSLRTQILSAPTVYALGGFVSYHMIRSAVFLN